MSREVEFRHGDAGPVPPYSDGDKKEFLVKFHSLVCKSIPEGFSRDPQGAKGSVRLHANVQGGKKETQEKPVTQRRRHGKLRNLRSM